MNLSLLKTEAARLGVSSIQVVLTLTFDHGGKVSVADAAEPPTHYHIVRQSDGKFAGDDDLDTFVSNRVQAYAFDAMSADEIVGDDPGVYTKLGVIGPVRDPMPDDIKHIVDNDVQDFKNGYKDPRDNFEANIDEIPADVRTNSRKLREFWRDYWNYHPA